jgi:hypothetical protein
MGFIDKIKANSASATLAVNSVECNNLNVELDAEINRISIMTGGRIRLLDGGVSADPTVKGVIWNNSNDARISAGV